MHTWFDEHAHNFGGHLNRHIDEQSGGLFDGLYTARGQGAPMTIGVALSVFFVWNYSAYRSRSIYGRGLDRQRSLQTNRQTYRLPICQPYRPTPIVIGEHDVGHNVGHLKITDCPANCPPDNLPDSPSVETSHNVIQGAACWSRGKNMPHRDRRTDKHVGATEVTAWDKYNCYLHVQRYVDEHSRFRCLVEECRVLAPNWTR